MRRKKLAEYNFFCLVWIKGKKQGKISNFINCLNFKKLGNQKIKMCVTMLVAEERHEEGSFQSLELKIK